MAGPASLMVHPSVTERKLAFSDRDFRYIAQLAHERTGIVLNPTKKDMVYSRLVRRLRVLKISSFSDYCSLLKSREGEGELGEMVNALTTNLTHFFREDHHFEHLRSVVLRDVMAKAKGVKRLRVWSAACSTGMEPYSIAMTVKETIKNLQHWDARILATDIDTNVLNTGSEGVYSLEEAGRIPARYREFVEIDSHKLTIKDEIKALIAFKELNLLHNWPMKGPFDAIFCRNVVIYFDKLTQSKIFDRMADMLTPGGWLYIGHSENLHNVCDRFESTGKTIYRRTK